MLYAIRKFSLILTISFAMVFSGFPNHKEVYAAIGDIGHWRDSIGGQIPGTTFSAFDFNQEIQNEGIYTRPNNSVIELDEAGDYLIIATTRDNDTSNGRYNSQLRIELTSGTGDIFSSYYSGYSRDNSENESWTRAVSVVIGASANAQFQVQKRRGTDVPAGGSVANASDVQVIKINPTNYGIYGIGGTNNAYGGVTPNTVDIDAIVSESNTAAIEGNTTTDTITIKGDNKKYLIAWSVSFTGSGSIRSQRIGHLDYDGVDELPTRSYCYGRNAANEYCGLGSMDIIETTSANIDIQTEVFRGPGVAADQGGADVDGNWVTDGNGQMIVLEMPDYLEVIRSFDSTGLQDITAAQTLNIARDVSFNDSLSFTKASNTAVDVTNPSKIFSWANIWTARNNVAASQRQTSFGSITIDGVEQTVGRHGSYSRGNQGTTDTFAMSFHPAGIFTTPTAGQDIGVNSDPLAGGETGGTDRTQPNTLGFFAINLDTLVRPIIAQSGYRFFENTDSTDVGPILAAQNTPATLASTGDDFRLRMLLNSSANKLRQNEKTLKLQFAERVGSCDITFTGETYSDITSSSLIAFNNNPTPNDGDNLTPNVNDPINGANTIINQNYEELNNFTTSVSAIGEDQDGKWDFSLTDNGALGGTSYCFRVVQSDNTLLDTYSVIPEITTLSVGQQTLSFSISDNTIGFGTLSSSSTRYADGSGSGQPGTLIPAHTISASTNATNGYTISIDGTEFSCINCTPAATIDPITGTPAVPQTGTEQFGIHADVASGTGSVVAPYNVGAFSPEYYYEPNVSDTILSGPGDDVVSIYDMFYMSNISPVTEAGDYEATITYTITASF